MKLLFVTENMHSEKKELLIIVNCVTHGFDGEVDYSLKLFGISLKDKTFKKLPCVEKWKTPIEVGNKQILSFFIFKRSISIIIFDDATVWHVQNAKN